jgi:hypothetical protein
MLTAGFTSSQTSLDDPFLSSICCVLLDGRKGILDDTP